VSGPIFIEAIESRVLMSAAPTLFDATVRADRIVVRADLLKFRVDLLTANARLSADLQAIKHSVPKGDTSLVAPFATLHADVKAMSLALQEERLTESANTLAAEATVKLDLVQILKDKHNATAEAADHAKLLTDRVAVQTALINGLDARIATRTADEATISADTAAIVTAASSDPAATAAMQAAVSTFSTDRVAKLNQLTADLQTVETARTNLSDALTAEQST
jgi:hypothetical protein